MNTKTDIYVFILVHVIRMVWGILYQDTLANEHFHAIGFLPMFFDTNTISRYKILILMNHW